MNYEDWIKKFKTLPKDFCLLNDENNNSIIKPENFEVQKILAGCLSEQKAKFSIKFQANCENIGSKCFCFGPRSKYNKNEALMFAKIYRESFSDENNLTRSVIKLIQIPIGLQHWLMGFMDGDGCIRQNNSNTIVSVYQSSNNDDPPPSLLIFHLCFGGFIKKGKSRSRGKIRPNKPEWAWNIFGKESKQILEMIVNHGNLKAPQARLALEALSKNRSPILSKQIKLTKEDANFYTKAISAAKKNYQNVEIDKTKITKEYIYGFFCAEGNIQVSTGTTAIIIKFTQFNSSNLLEAIKEKLGNIGTVDFGRLLICGDNAIKILKEMQYYLLEKKSQCDLVLKHREVTKVRNKRPRTKEEIKDDLEVENTCKRLKKYQGEPKVGINISEGNTQIEI